MAAALYLLLGGGVTAPGIPGQDSAATAASAAPCPSPLRGLLTRTPSPQALTAGTGQPAPLSPQAEPARSIALTFDDGPGPMTAQVLAVLARHRVHATFFQIGQRVAAFPQGSRQVAAAGHALGNHSYTHPLAVPGDPKHPRFDALPAAAQAAEIDRTTAAIVKATGRRPCAFRAPGGEGSAPTSVALVNSRQMTDVQWTVSSSDSAAPAQPRPDAQESILRAATSSSSTHLILLMHDGPQGRPNTLAVLDQVIAHYAALGYTFTDTSGRPFPG